MPITWLKGLGIGGVLATAGSIVGIATADYTFPVPDASVGFMVMPTENQFNRFLNDFRASDRYEEILRECRAGLRSCDGASLQRAILPDADALPPEYWSFTVVVTNNSDLDIRNLHVSFLARDADRVATWHDYLHPGQTIEAEKQIMGSLPLNDILAAAASIDVCVSYRGRFHLDVVRKEFTMYRSLLYHPSLPGFEVVAFDNRGEVEESTLLKASHCPKRMPDAA